MRKKPIIKAILCCMILFCLSGCAGKINIPEQNELLVEAGQEEETKREETIIDYPFEESLGYKLTLAKLPDLVDEYELVLYDKEGEVLQQIPCGRLKEPIEFSYDGLQYGWHHKDLEIFSSGSKTGLLFLQEEEGFAQEAIEIPRYTEERNGAILTVTNDADMLKKQICFLNEGKGQITKVRNFFLDKDTGWLEIRDCLENENLFEGKAELDENGNPVNSEYYEMLMWYDLKRPWKLDKQQILRAWIGEETELNKESGHKQDYEDREVFLKEFGFENSEPTYQFHDRYGNLQLELYVDEEAKVICGIVHRYRFNNELEQVEFLYGFTQCILPEAEWEGQDPYHLKSIRGTDGAGKVPDYEERTEYRDDGRTDYFKAEGMVQYEDGEEKVPILEINFIYREDGTLYCRDYYHNEKIFGTTESTLDSFYDEKERVVYESGYITHGSVEYYYIYEDESDKPAYCLYLDHNLGYVIPQMVRYR